MLYIPKVFLASMYKGIYALYGKFFCSSALQTLAYELSNFHSENAARRGSTAVRAITSW